MATPHADETAIREQAYYFWEQEGRPEGRAADFWLRAVEAVGARTAPATMKAHEKVRDAAPAKAVAGKSKLSPAKSEPAKKPKKK